MDIYHKLDAKSNIAYNGRKFKKSDILSANRKLMFEGVGTLIQAKNRTILVTVVILSDIMIFLQESNQKYFFIMPENKVIQTAKRINKQKNRWNEPRNIIIKLTMLFFSQA